MSLFKTEAMFVCDRCDRHQFCRPGFDPGQTDMLDAWMRVRTCGGDVVDICHACAKSFVKWFLAPTNEKLAAAVAEIAERHTKEDLDRFNKSIDEQFAAARGVVNNSVAVLRRAADEAGLQLRALDETDAA